MHPLGQFNGKRVSKMVEQLAASEPIVGIGIVSFNKGSAPGGLVDSELQ